MPNMRAAHLCKKATALVSFAALLFLAPDNFAARAQESTRLAAIHFTGLDHFADEQVARATGLKIGQPVSQELLGAAANHLGESGAFETVSFRYTTKQNQITVEFQVKETRHLLPCRFDNFVWFSDSQLDRTLRARVAFYAGVIPEAGSTTEEVRAALRDLLRSNGIPGEVDSIPVAPAVGQPVNAILYTVKGISLPIRSVDFPGAAAVSAADLRAASSQIMGRDYSSSGVALFASGGLVPLYHHHGYLRAGFAEPQGAILNKNSDATAYDIAVTLPVSEGPEFFWEKAEWSGNRQFTPAELDRLLAMQPREIADESKIDAGLNAIRHAYGQRGYIEASVRSNVDLNDSERLASYKFYIAEGPQFHISQVHFDGLADKAALALIKKWTLKPGDIFDDSYASDFMSRIAPQTLQDFGVLKAKIEIKPQIDRQNSSVDLHIVVH
jgi:outer membrane protein assembly factor BamA